MSKIRQDLYKSLDQAIQSIIQQLEGTSSAQELTEAMSRLRNAIGVKNDQDLKKSIDASLTADISVDKISTMQLLTCDEMLEASMLVSEDVSLKHILTKADRFNDVVNLLERPDSQLSSMSRGTCYLSNMGAVELCSLASKGDIETIKKAKISSYRVNQIVASAVTSGPATHLGYYNAVHIAAAHRQFDVLKFFVESKGALLNVKGGRHSDLTPLDCAGSPSWMLYPAVNADIQEYLTTKEMEQNCPPAPRRSYRDALMNQQTLFTRPPVNSVSESANTASHSCSTFG